MRNIAVIAVLALAGVPGGALAAQPSHPATPANSNANTRANGASTTGTSSNANANAQTNTNGRSVKVMFVLRGKLGAYTPATGTTDGSIAITVKSSNHESTLLESSTLTFAVSSKTTVVGTVTSGDEGIVKVRAARNASAATLQTKTAFEMIDQGTSA